MARRVAVVAAWSVLAFLLLSKSAFAASEPKFLRLNKADALSLFNRMKVLRTLENLPDGRKASVKRFTTLDGAVRITCTQLVTLTPAMGTACLISLDPARSNPKMTTINQGYIYNSMVFTIRQKQDVKSVVESVIASQKFVASERVTAEDQQGGKVTISRFVLDCPRDWVFDAVACDGHIIGRQ